MKNITGYVFGASLVATGFIAAIGWFGNFVQVVLAALADSPFGALLVVKIAGIFVPPLGSIMGLIGFFN